MFSENLEQTDDDSDESTVSSRIIEMPSQKKFSLVKKMTTLSCKLTTMKQKLNAKRIQNYRSRQKKKYSFSKDDILNEFLQNKSSNVKTFVRMQIYHKIRKPWSQAEKQLALSIYYKSPSCYKFMCNNLKFVLPSVRTIQDWLRVTSLRTGVDVNLKQRLKLKAKSMSTRERMCVVMVDEVSIKKQLEYHRTEDAIEGYEDLGFLGTSSDLGNNALVVMIRGLLHNWKMPLAYYISSGPVNSRNLQQIIVNVFVELKQMSFCPAALVCDQGSNNRSAVQALGATKEDPTFEIEGDKIVVIFDAPHLLKSLRNNLMNSKVQFHTKDGLVCWKDIVDTFEIDKMSQSTRALLKITTKHMYPNSFQKMKVKYAAQIFSKTVSATVKTAYQTKQLSSSTAVNTAAFLETINRLFDVLNSRCLRDPNKDRRPLSIYDDNCINILVNGLEYFKDIRVLEGTTVRRNIYCIDGFLWTIKGVLLLWESLKAQGVKYLPTSFLNQDAIEHLFSVIRSRGGYNPTPTVRQFRIALQSNINIRLMNGVDSGNCSEDTTPMLNLSPEEDQVSQQNVTEEEFNPTHSSSLLVGETVELTPTLESCTNVYFAGYLAYRITKKYNCNDCFTKFVNNTEYLQDNSQLYLLNRDYSSENILYLKVPTEEFVRMVVFMLNNFNNLYESFKTGRNIMKNIENSLTFQLKAKFDMFNTAHNEICFSHHRFFVKLFTKVKLLRKLKWDSQELTKSSQEKRNRKIAILSASS